MARAAKICALSLALALASCGQARPSESRECDRACIVGVTDSYLAALASRDPAAAPLAANPAFVENLMPLKPGEGLWKTISAGKGGFAIYVPDPRLQQAGWMGVVEREGKPVLLALRLKLENSRIVEVEHLVTEPAQGDLANLVQVRRGLLAPIPEEDRLPHAELLRIGATYYDALDDNDGAKAPFAPDCQRIENGRITAGANTAPPPNAVPGQPRTATGCAAQLSSQAFVYIDRIDNRRMIAADPVTGLAMGLSHLRHPMTNLPYKVTLADGSIAERNHANMPYEPFDMPAAHIFKIGADGDLHEIEAVGVVAPFNSATGWE